jgi:hypothetical protein
MENPKYDVNTDYKDHGWDIIGRAIEGPVPETTIRDNTTGKIYTSTGETFEDSRDNAWDLVNKDRND